MTTILKNEPTHRLRVRRVDEYALSARTRETALRESRWSIMCDHGGSVANAYGYAADTEGALAISDPQGRVVVFMCRVPANKVTLGGVANACLPGTRALFDGRYTTANKVEAARMIARRAHLLVVAATTATGSTVAALSPTGSLRDLDLSEGVLADLAGDDPVAFFAMHA